MFRQPRILPALSLSCKTTLLGFITDPVMVISSLLSPWLKGFNLDYLKLQSLTQPLWVTSSSFLLLLDCWTLPVMVNTPDAEAVLQPL